MLCVFREVLEEVTSQRVAIVPGVLSQPQGQQYPSRDPRTTACHPQWAQPQSPEPWLCWLLSVFSLTPSLRHHKALSCKSSSWSVSHDEDCFLF